MGSKFYITTTLPYVNAEPHLGFGLEIIQADVIARYQSLLGNEVVFNFGTDEHGLKIYRKAIEQNKDPQEYCDEYAKKFDALKSALNLSYTNFIRTTDLKHIVAAQEFWRRCYANGDIYKKNYSVKYCVGCELEKTDSDLVEGKCPLHPTYEIELIEEENYFFRFSKYQEPLLKFYREKPNFVVPEGKYNEIRSFVENGLEDFSVSRLKAKMPWGVAVPDDPEHVMYVWFDALVNYVSTIDWPQDEQKFMSFWPGLQVAGVDNLRQQTAIWQAMLMSAGLANSKQVFIHGFITINGQKISKSLGNVINAVGFAEKYGADPLRYYLLAKIHPWEGSDFSEDKFIETYNADLANGLGNLVSRVAKLAEKCKFQAPNPKSQINFNNQIINYLNEFRFDEALKEIWVWVSEIDKKIEVDKPWTLKGDELKEVLGVYVEKIRIVADALRPFMPDTAGKILKQFEAPVIKSFEPMFPRIK